MTAFALSIVRTIVPIIVGSVISWLAVLGLNIDEAGQEGITVFLTGLLIALYYLIVRLIEQKFPGVGVLIGSAKSPDTYSKGDVIQDEVVPEEPWVEVQRPQPTEGSDSL